MRSGPVQAQSVGLAPPATSAIDRSGAGVAKLADATDLGSGKDIKLFYKINVLLEIDFHMCPILCPKYVTTERFPDCWYILLKSSGTAFRLGVGRSLGQIGGLTHSTMGLNRDLETGNSDP
jgi:hypothetical protein